MRRGLCVAVAILVGTAPAAAATPFDPTFGVDGIGGGDLGPSYSQTSFTAVSEQDDGSLLATRGESVWRYFGSGALDTSFAPRSSYEFERQRVLATQADGKVIVRAEESGAVRRLNPDGSPDAGFNGGESERGPRWGLVPEAVEVLSSGKILVAGPRSAPTPPKGWEYEVALERLRPDGTLDAGFGEDGMVNLELDFDVDDAGFRGLVVYPDEAVLVATDRSLVKLGADGKLDRGYGSGGVVEPAPRIVGIHDAGAGKVLVAGQLKGCCAEPPGRDFFAARYGPAGSLDPSFGAGRGFVTADSGGNDLAHTVLWEADGSILVGGITKSPIRRCWELDYCEVVPSLARFTAVGGVDSRFGRDGVLEVDALAARVPGFTEGILDLAARRTGGAIVAGDAGPDQSVAFLAAIDSAGRLDPGFGDGGIVRERTPGSSSQRIDVLAVADDGKILAAGSTSAAGGFGAKVIRYGRNGAVDRSYGGGTGIAWAPDTEGAVALAPARSGAAVLLSPSGEVTRFTRAGRVDRRFGEGRPLKVHPGWIEYRDVAVLPSGKVLLAGWSGESGDSTVNVVRLLRDGRPDRSFGSGGLATLSCGRWDRCVVSRMAVQADGRILLAGEARNLGLSTVRVREDPSRLLLARLRPNGRPDPAFGNDGLVTRRVDRHTEAHALALSGRRILVAGWTSSGHGRRTLLARFRLDGRLDRSFGRDGVAFSLHGAIPTAVLPTANRIFVVSKKSVGRTPPTGPLVLAFHPDGRPDRRHNLRQRAFGPAQNGAFLGAMQGGRPILAWTARGEQRYTSMIRLARLSAD